MNLLGIDFEDWFHPELIQRHISGLDKTPTVVNGIDKIIDWLRKNETSATFFVVGELLESKPELLDKIIGNGHEIAFHTMHHTRIDSINFKEKFTEEIKLFDKMTSKKSKGFRAPSFSLNNSSSWILDVLADNNYVYDSSVMPAKTRLYGIPNADIKPYRIGSYSLEQDDPKNKILEFPLLTTQLLGYNFPACGGFYLRFLPLKIIERAIKNNMKKNIPSTFFIHSWELTPEFMQKVNLPFTDNFITYHNIEKALSKMDSLLKKFEFTSFEKFISKNKLY
ncbi:MAG: xylanase [Thaumarchaeota archaeon]|nr:MAG: xylanase [Nitrososphaerota archaeon]